jgi:hypothetical protein
MPRAVTIRDPQPYRPFGRFAGLSFWPGGLTLLAAAPGIGKTSWLLRMVFEAACQGFPAALGCYEHTPEELKYRLVMQAQAVVAGAHEDNVDNREVEKLLAQGSQAVLLSLSDQEDTLRALEEMLIQDFDFPVRGPALLAVDYLQRVPVVGATGMLPEEKRGGEAAVQMRALARRHGWGLVAASALRAEAFSFHTADLTALLGDECVPYEADRILFVSRGETLPCGCLRLLTQTLKDRTGPLCEWDMTFWGRRFYPALEGEECQVPSAMCHVPGVK